MQILALHCQSFTYTPISPSTTAADLPEQEIGAPVLLGECLFALVCVQPGDNPATARRAAKGLRRIARHTSVKKIAINAFAHLAADLADPATTQCVVDALAGRLDESPDWDVITMPYGWRKHWQQMEVLPGEWAQRSIHVAPHIPPRRDWTASAAAARARRAWSAWPRLAWARPAVAKARAYWAEGRSAERAATVGFTSSALTAAGRRRRRPAAPTNDQDQEIG